MNTKEFSCLTSSSPKTQDLIRLFSAMLPLVPDLPVFFDHVCLFLASPRHRFVLPPAPTSNCQCSGIASGLLFPTFERLIVWQTTSLDSWCMDDFPDCPDHTIDEMVYTKARLEHALRAFRKEATHRRKGLDALHLEEYLQPSRWSLRKPTKLLSLVNVSIWQDKDKNGGSEDDEYDPRKEKKQLLSARKKKRKADDVEDEDKVVKRNRVEEETQLSTTKDVWLTLKLATLKGKQLLADLEKQHNTQGRRRDQENDQPEPSYLSHYRNSSKAKRRVLGLDMPETDDVLTEMDIDNPLALDVATLGPTALRSGRLLKKTRKDKKPTREEADSKEGQDASTVVKDLTNKPRPQVVTSHVTRHAFTPASSRGKFAAVGSYADPIDLLDDSEDDVGRPMNFDRTRHHQEEQINIKQELPPTPISQRSDSFSWNQTKQAQAFHDESGILTITTCYAHPIQFFSTSGDDCHFCMDYRMGIIGHGQRAIQVFRDPDSPHQFLELGNGHRSNGNPNTQMCAVCSRERLMMLRCHNTDQEEEVEDSHDPIPWRPPESNAPVFAHIQVSDFDRLQHTYLDQLFKKIPMEFPSASSNKRSQPPLPICNLCPAPAIWKCCKWQKHDIRRRPCRTPFSKASAASSHGNKIRTTLTSAHRPHSTSSRADSATHSSGLSSPASPFSNASLVPDDSDSDPDFPVVSKSAASLMRSRSYTSSHKSRSPSKAQQTRPTPMPSATSSDHSSPLRPPVRGCGLHLCGDCHRFVTTQCDFNATLDKRKIARWLRPTDGEKAARRGSQFGPRADVEFLFRGGLLERWDAAKGSH